ncbi:YraN family protein [Alkalilimnicola ehrlichii]|uniref:YraN family protein n=1 Tax=Alkalilimnicola ehrlichii TaxID=351052 RepID=UPI003B9E0952
MNRRRPSAPAPHLETGNRGERRALEHLTGQGLELLECNFRCRAGEIDLIMRDGEVVVFVEVRVRTHPGYGGALASITPAKQRRLARAAARWLQRHRLTQRAVCRFDVVTFDGEGPQWLRHAFTAPG